MLESRKKGPRLGPAAGAGQGSWGAVLGALTWWASHPHWAPAANVSLGANGPRKSLGTNLIWGRNLISFGFAPVRPWPQPPSQHLPSRGSSGALVFSLTPGSPGVGGGRGKQGSVLSRFPVPSSTSGAGAASIRAAGLPRTPVLRGPWRTRKTQAYRGPSWESAAGQWASLSPAHYHKGVCSLPTHSP